MRETDGMVIYLFWSNLGLQVPRHAVHKHRRRDARPGGYRHPGRRAAAPDPADVAPPRYRDLGREQRKPGERGYGNFDIIFDRFARMPRPRTTPTRALQR